MTLPSADRAPHGLAIQLIPQYFKIERAPERLVFTTEGRRYYQHWYSRHGRTFKPEGLTWSQFKAELLALVATELDDASASIEQSLQTREILGLEARVARALVQAKFKEAAALAGLTAQARASAVVSLPTQFH